MPVSGSGVMLVDQMVPNGVSIARPPALTAPPAVVWHTAQLPSAASCSPFAIVAADQVDGSGRATGAIDRHGSASALMPTTAATIAAALAKAPAGLANGFCQVLRGGCGGFAGSGSVVCAPSAPRNPARI